MKNSLSSKIKHRDFSIVIIVWLLISNTEVASQATSVGLGNLPQPGINYLGWDASLSPEPLSIRHETPGQPIIFRTNNQERMRMLVDGTVAVNSTLNDGARFNVFQDQGGTAVFGLNSNSDGYNWNRVFRTRVTQGLPNSIGIEVQNTPAFEAVAIGVSGIAQSSSGQTQYGVYGRTVGNGTPNNPNNGNWAAVFYGNVGVVNGTYQGSDSLLKSNVESIQEVRESLISLRPVSFEFIESEAINFSEGVKFGFIAQEMENVFPELVRLIDVPIRNEDGEITQHDPFYAINHIEIIPILVKGMQEHDELFEENNLKIEDLSSLLQEVQSLTESLINE